jgi:ADP-ribose pyrophosphatase
VATVTRRVARQTVYSGRKFSVHVDRVTTASGTEHEREIVEHVASAVIVPVEAGNVLFVQQYRYPIEQPLLELPAGTVDPGEDVLTTAHRELLEETGYDATEMVALGDFFSSPGYSTEVMSLFLATSLTVGTARPDDDEEIELVRMPFDEAVARARAGGFNDLKTVAALLLAGERIS